MSTLQRLPSPVLLTLALLPAACSTSSNKEAASTDGPATTSAMDARELEVISDTLACLWPTAVRYTLQNFDFRLTAPDGMEYSRASFKVDASIPVPQLLTGIVTEAQASSLKIDTCAPGAGCQPTVYAFRFCTSYNCDASSDLQVRIPVGQKIRVDWRLVGSGSFDPGTAYLAAFDDGGGVTRGALLLAGAAGMEVREGVRFAPSGLPFDFSLVRQNCRSSGAYSLFSEADDYTMIVARRDGLGSPMSLVTGAVGSLDYALAAGGSARARIHCLSAVQPAATDDYWNWSFWLESDPTAP